MEGGRVEGGGMEVGGVGMEERRNKALESEESEG